MRLQSRLVGMVGVALLVTGIAGPAVAKAQDPVAGEACGHVPGAVASEAGCTLPVVDSSAVPGTIPWVSGQFTYVPDGTQDVRKDGGEIVDRTDLDVTEVWYRVGKLSPGVLTLVNGPASIRASDARPDRKTSYLQVLARIAGDILDPKAGGPSVLLGVATARDDRPGNDFASSAATPFSLWNGIDRINEGGLFAGSTTGAGGTDLDAHGAFERFYNAPSGMVLLPLPDDQLYLTLIPVKNMGQEFRVFTQSTLDDQSIGDLVGDPGSPDTLLPLDGTFSVPVSCAEIFVPGRPTDTSAAAQLRLVGVPADTTLDLQLTPAPSVPSTTRPKPTTMLGLGGVGDGDGLVFDLGSLEPNQYTVVITGAHGEGVSVDAIRVPRHVDIRPGAGHVAGSLNCARSPIWQQTATPCANADLITSLFGADAIGSEFVDDQFAACAGIVNGTPVGALTIARFPVSVEFARSDLIPDLATPGCPLAEQAIHQFDFLATRTCSDGTTNAVLAVEDELAAFAQFESPPADFLDQAIADMETILESQDLDGDSIPNYRDDDVDGDGLANEDDDDDDNDGVTDLQDRNPYDATIR